MLKHYLRALGMLERAWAFSSILHNTLFTMSSGAPLGWNQNLFIFHSLLITLLCRGEKNIDIIVILNNSSHSSHTSPIRPLSWLVTSNSTPVKGAPLRVRSLELTIKSVYRKIKPRSHGITPNDITIISFFPFFFLSFFLCFCFFLSFVLSKTKSAWNHAGSW